MANTIYLNGDFIPYDQAKLGIEDRGFLFADGVYEVISIYRQVPFKFEEHFIRLKNSVDSLDINFSDYDKLKKDAEKLIAESGYTDAKLYIQISRGEAPRTHSYPDGMVPTVMMKVSELKGNPEKYYQKGVKAITLPDERWSRCHIKSVALLPNILAKKKAKTNGAYEAIQIRNGFVTDGTSSNVFIVKDEKIITPPPTNYLLNGITRRVVLGQAEKLGFTITEGNISLDQLLDADEVFLTGTTTEIMSVVNIDGKTIGSGQPGRFTEELYRDYQGLK